MDVQKGKHELRGALKRHTHLVLRAPLLSKSLACHFKSGSRIQVSSLKGENHVVTWPGQAGRTMSRPNYHVLALLVAPKGGAIQGSKLSDMSSSRSNS